MKKVFIVHGLNGKPNGGWRPWLMAELEKLEVYACALSMPDPAEPKQEEWVAEIARHLERNAADELYVVGHSLGVPTVLRCVENFSGRIAGAVFVSGRVEPTSEPRLAPFFAPAFDFAKIKSRVAASVVIHGDDDPVVPFKNAEVLSKELGAELITIPHGKHLNGSAGFHALPQALEALKKMF